MKTAEYLQSKYGASLTPSQFANETHHSATHIRALLQQDVIHGKQIGRRWHIPVFEAARLIGEGETSEA